MNDSVKLFETRDNSTMLSGQFQRAWWSCWGGSILDADHPPAKVGLCCTM